MFQNPQFDLSNSRQETYVDISTNENIYTVSAVKKRTYDFCEESLHWGLISNFIQRQEIRDFLASDGDGFHLQAKAVMVVALYGGLHCDEVSNLDFSMIPNFKSEIVNDFVTVNYFRRQKTSNAPHVFWIPKHFMDVNVLKILVQYFDLLMSEEGRVWKLWNKASKTFYDKFPAGKHTLRKIPAYAAKFLKLQDPEAYTWHSFRRIGATLLADCGVSGPELQRWGRWRLAPVAQGYIDSSISAAVDRNNQENHNKLN
jgi:hypothetical protein